MHRLSITFSDDEWSKIQAIRASQAVKPTAAAVVRHLVLLAPLDAARTTFRAENGLSGGTSGTTSHQSSPKPWAIPNLTDEEAKAQLEKLLKEPLPPDDDD